MIKKKKFNRRCEISALIVFLLVDIQDIPYSRENCKLHLSEEGYNYMKMGKIKFVHSKKCLFQYS